MNGPSTAGRHLDRAATTAVERRRPSASPRATSSAATAAHPQQHRERVVVRAADDVHQHQRVEPDDQRRAARGSRPRRRAHAQTSATIAEARERRDRLQVQNAAGTPSFASGKVATVNSGP